MKKVLIVLLSCFSFIPTFAQSESYIQKEANPNDPIVIDNSEYAQL